ncbi:MAG: glycosyltransferase family 2 protein [bacterium]|nr:glycosyltransferase family 2 protein [bacterium]
MRVCIIIPMHNEEAVAEQCVRTVLPYLDALPHATSLCIVNDGSRDATPRILADLAVELADARLAVCHHDTNRGYGAALRTGIRHAIDGAFDYVLFMDSDLTNHPKYLTLFYKRMSEGVQYIKASRYTVGGAVAGVPFIHRTFSRIGNSVARQCYGLPIRDITNGFRAVHTTLLRQMVFTEDGFAMILEELTQAKRLGATFSEVPYTLTSRGRGEGSSHLSYGLKTWKQYLGHALRARQ